MKSPSDSLCKSGEAGTGPCATTMRPRRGIVARLAGNAGPAPEAPILDRTYVIGFWRVDKNPKRDCRHYIETLNRTLRYLAGGRIVFVSDCAGLNARVRDIVTSDRGRFHGIRMPISELEKFRQSAAFLDAVKAYGQRRHEIDYSLKKDKGENHFRREYLKGTEASYRAMLTIWHSKLDLLAHVARSNPFDTAEICWADASVSRFVGRRAHWDFRHLAVQADRLCLYPNRMTKQGRVIRYNASVLLAGVVDAEDLKTRYDATLTDFLREPYPNDEETIMDEMARAGHDVFACIGQGAAAAESARRYDAAGARLHRLMTRLRKRAAFLQPNPLRHCAYFE